MAKGPRIRPKVPVPAYLALWRKSKGLTQEELADILGTTKSNISRWENDKRAPDNGVMGAYAEALKVPITSLYRPPDQKLLDDALHGAPDDVRKQVMDMAEFLMQRPGKK